MTFIKQLIICSSLLVLAACGGGETEKVFVPDLEQGDTIDPSMSFNSTFDNGRMSLRIPAGVSNEQFNLQVIVASETLSNERQQILTNTYSLSPLDKNTY